MRYFKRLLTTLLFLAAACQAGSALAVPTVTDLAGYNEGGFNGGDIVISALVPDALPFTVVYFEYYTSADDTWHSIGKDTDGTDGYSIVWRTGDLVDFSAKIRAKAETAGAATDPRVESLQVVNIVPDSITGYTNPDSGTLDLTAHVVPPQLSSYFPPNPWAGGGGYTWVYSYTVFNNNSANEAPFAGTVDKITTYFPSSGYWWYSTIKLKLFKIDAANGQVVHVWTSSNQSAHRGNAYTYNVNVPNVPKGAQLGGYFYRCSPYLGGHTGNPRGAYYKYGDVQNDSAVGSWRAASGWAVPMRAHIYQTIDPPTAVQFGYSLDGGETFNMIGSATDQGDGNWSITFDTAALGLASRNFILGARAWNGGAWCTWYQSPPFMLTNPVEVTVRTNLGSTAELYVDGVRHVGEYSGTWNYFDPHEVSVPEYQMETADSRRVFDHWSDDGARTHDASIESPDATTLTAYYAAEYYLTVLSENTYISGDASGYYREGTRIQITAEAVHPIDNYNRYRCTGWSSPELGESDRVECQFDITQPTTVRFNWVLEYFFEVRNDLYSSTEATTGWYAADSVIRASVPQYVNAGIGVRYRCTGYTGTGALTYGVGNTTGDFSINIPTSITWSWQLEYELIVESNAGTPTGGGWYDEGTTVTIDVDLPDNPDWERYTFRGWTGTGDGSVTSDGGPVQATVTLNGPIREFADFKTEYYLRARTTGAAAVDFVPNPSGWYEKGAVVTAILGDPPDTDTVRYVPEWRSDSEAGVNYPRALDNPRQVTFTLSSPIDQIVEWHAQYRFDVLNPQGVGVTSPPVGQYWYYEGETVTADCSLDGGLFLCDGWTGTGDLPDGDGTHTSFVITQWTTITWRWTARTGLPVQYWHPAEPIGPKMNSRALDMVMIDGAPLVCLYDDNTDSVVLLAPTVESKTDWTRTVLLSGMGEVANLDLEVNGADVYVTFVTADEKVYLLHYDGASTEPIELDEEVGEGCRSVLVTDAAGRVHVFYRKGIFGDLVERVFDEALGQWVENLVDVSASRGDLDAVTDPIGGMPVVLYRKGIYLYGAAFIGDAWNIEQGTEGGNAGHELKAAADPSGGVFISYADISDYRGSRLFVAVNYFGNWTTSLVDPTFGGGYGSDIALGPGSLPQVTHRSEDKIFFARFNGSSWETAVVAEGVVADGPTFIGIKDDGRPVCLFFDDGVPMLAEAKAEPYEGGGGDGGDGGDDGGGTEPPTGGGGGGCFIATAAFGSLAAADVRALTDVRDGALSASSLGSALVFSYYAVSPSTARAMRRSEALRALARSFLR